MTSETWHLQLVEKGCGDAHYKSNLADTVLHMSLPISAGHRSFRASSPSNHLHIRVGRFGTVCRRNDACPALLSSPLLLFFFPLHLFLPVFVSFSSTKVSTRKKGGRRRRRRSEGKFDKFLERATRSLQMDRSIVLWYFEFGCSFCQLKKDAFT